MTYLAQEDGAITVRSAMSDNNNTITTYNNSVQVHNTTSAKDKSPTLRENRNSTNDLLKNSFKKSVRIQLPTDSKENSNSERTPRTETITDLQRSVNSTNSPIRYNKISSLQIDSTDSGNDEDIFAMVGDSSHGKYESKFSSSQHNYLTATDHTHSRSHGHSIPHDHSTNMNNKTKVSTGKVRKKSWDDYKSGNYNYGFEYTKNLRKLVTLPSPVLFETIPSAAEILKALDKVSCVSLIAFSFESICMAGYPRFSHTIKFTANS